MWYPKNIIKEYHSVPDYLSARRFHRRFKVFFNKGTKCIFCGLEGTKVLLWADKKGARHADLFAADGTMMTVDHTIPKSRGGTNDLSNLEPACSKCNQKKADKILDTV